MRPRFGLHKPIFTGMNGLYEMKDDILTIKNISKVFRSFHSPNDHLKFLINRLIERCLKGLFFFSPKLIGLVAKKLHFSNYQDFWAVNDISLSVRRGEILGLVGENGSGKSTLLSLIAGVYKPNTGSIELRGSVASILELGAGFNVNFTGRDNLLLSAEIHNIPKDEIHLRIDDAITFSELGFFIDMPLKTYSSGMATRLAFSAAHMAQPELLIIDEALAVGDERFQRKCFAALEGFRQNGGTIIFVSHSTNLILNLCTRAVLICKGSIQAEGAPKSVIGQYLKVISMPKSQLELGAEISSVAEVERAIDTILPEPVESMGGYFDANFVSTSTINLGGSAAIISSIVIYDINERKVNNLFEGQIYVIEYYVQFKLIVENVLFGVMIKTLDGVEIGGGRSSDTFSNRHNKFSKEDRIRVRFQFECCLNPGIYYLNLGVVGAINGSGVEQTVHRLIDATCFRVVSQTNQMSNGTVNFKMCPSITLI